MIIMQTKRPLQLTENVAYHGGAGDPAGCARADRLGTRTALGYVRLFFDEADSALKAKLLQIYAKGEEK